MSAPRLINPVNLNAILGAQSMSSAGAVLLKPKRGDYILARMPPDQTGTDTRGSLGVRIMRQEYNGFWCIAECGSTLDFKAKLKRTWTAHDQNWRDVGDLREFYDFTAIRYVFSGKAEAEETIKLLTAFNSQEEIVNAMARARAAVVDAIIAGDVQSAQNITYEHNKLIDQIKDAGLTFATKLKMLEG